MSVVADLSAIVVPSSHGKLSDGGIYGTWQSGSSEGCGADLYFSGYGVSYRHEWRYCSASTRSQLHRISLSEPKIQVRVLSVTTDHDAPPRQLYQTRCNSGHMLYS